MFRGDAKSWMFLSLIFILATTSCTHRSPRVNQSGFPEKDYQYQKPELIPEDWETASIKEANIDSAKMNEMMQEILGGNDRNLHSILIVKNGKLVFEEYFYEYDRERLHYLASVSKSITSILVGIAMEQSPSDGVEKMVYEFFPEYSHTKWIDQKYPITLQHVLTMSAGLDWDASKYSRKDPRHTTHQMYDSDDPAEFVLDRNTIRVAGDKFYYNSGLTILLGEIVKSTSGMSIDEFAGKYLFEPLGISNYQWDKFNNGMIQTDGGLSLRPRDMAKVGYLMMKEGTWKGKQIVSKKWVAESTRKHIDALGGGYGYQWWIGETKTYDQPIEVLIATGHGGQKIFIIPEFDLVVVFTSKVFNPKGHTSPEGFLFHYILPAVDPSLVPKKAVPLTPEILEKYVGKYWSEEHHQKLPVIRKGDKLYIKESFWSKVELKPRSTTQFFGESKQVGKVFINFVMDPYGQVKQFIAYLGFRGFRFDKIE